MYDDFSEDYDRFVNWESRLRFELPFLEAQLQAAGGQSVLDAACGTGMHTIALAQAGYAAAGADLSAPMIARAQANAAAAGAAARFAAAGFGQQAAAFGAGSFQAVLCLGNSLPHVGSPAELAAALEDFAACLSPGGLLLLQNRNFDRVLAEGQRWMGPQGYRQGQVEWLFVRFYDFLPDGMLSFNILSLRRPAPEAAWEQRLLQTRLMPLRHAGLSAALHSAGFTDLRAYGSLGGEAFDPQASENLVLTARKRA
jgi:SAM-dependent methyltransferase